MPLAEGVKWFEAAQGKLLAVADGVSGAPEAQLASNIAIRSMAEYLVGELSWATDMRSESALRLAFESALLHCQSELRRLSGDNRAGSSMTVAYINWPHLFIASVGDTRAFIVREGTIMQLTRDDTLAQDLVERQVTESKDLSPRMNNIITNAIGCGTSDLVVECHRRELELGDRVVICSDGITAHLDNLEIAEIIREAPFAETASRMLIDEAVDRGGSDNATAVVACIHPVPVSAVAAGERPSASASASAQAPSESVQRPMRVKVPAATTGRN